MRKVIFTLLCGLLLTTSNTFAQPAISAAPLIIIHAGHLYAVGDDGQVIALTDDGLDYRDGHPLDQADAFLSPDGSKLVYRYTPDFFAQALADNLTGNLGVIPNDLVLLDLVTMESSVIAAHEADAAWNNPASLYYRGRWSVDWSPDGSQIAYLETVAYPEHPNFASRVVVYDVASGESRVLAESNVQVLGSILEWTEDGILVDNARYNPEDGSLTTMYLNGNVYALGRLHGYLHHEGHVYLPVFSLDVDPSDEVFYFMDMATGEYVVTESWVSSVSERAPETSLVFVDDTNDTRPNSVYDQEGNLVFTPPAGPPYAAEFVISPDGTRFAYILVGENGGGAYIRDAVGNETVIDMSPNALVWGSQRYVVFEEDGSQTLEVMTDFYNETVCGSLPAVGLIAGGQGRVLDGTPNRIRSTPSAEAEVIGEIAAGEVFDVVDGQQGVCSDGIRWAQVSYNGVSGWTAEGADGEAFVQPEG